MKVNERATGYLLEGSDESVHSIMILSDYMVVTVIRYE
jgi:hypothetical protein